MGLGESAPGDGDPDKFAIHRFHAHGSEPLVLVEFPCVALGCTMQSSSSEATSTYRPCAVNDVEQRIATVLPAGKKTCGSRPYTSAWFAIYLHTFLRFAANLPVDCVVLRRPAAAHRLWPLVQSVAEIKGFGALLDTSAIGDDGRVSACPHLV